MKTLIFISVPIAISLFIVIGYLTQFSFAQTNSNSTFLTYKDPNGRYTIQYPPGFKVEPATNRFETTLVEIMAPEGSDLSLFDVAVKRLPGHAAPMETIKASMAEGNSIPNFLLQEDPNCDKYIVDGKKACSIVFTRTIDYTSEYNFPVMQIITNIKKSTYILEYYASPDNFDKNLPLAEKIIKSFHVLA